MVLVLLLSWSGPTAPCDPWPASIALHLTRRDTELRSTWNLAALSGPPKIFAPVYGVRSSAIFFYHKALENIGVVDDNNARVQWWLENLTAFDYVRTREPQGQR